jgi:hypothetical protein
MDSEAKKPQFDEEAIWMEMEEAEQQEIDEDDPMELEEEDDDEINSSREDEDDEVHRLESEYDRLITTLKEWDLPNIVARMQAEEKYDVSESEEDTDENEDEDDEDEDGIEIWKISRNDEGCGKE